MSVTKCDKNIRKYGPVVYENLKVGDRVRVKSIEWYNSNKNLSGYVVPKNEFNDGFPECLKNYCSLTATVTRLGDGTIFKELVFLKFDGNEEPNYCNWHDWMLEYE